MKGFSQHYSDLKLENTSETQALILVGSLQYFSDRLIETFKAEFASITVIRVASLTELAEVTARGVRAIAVVVEESKIDHLIDFPSAYFDAAKTAKLALAYYEESIAERLAAASVTKPDLANVGFLPLHVQMDVWLSVLNLLIRGKLYFPQEFVAGLSTQNAEDAALEESPSELTAREWQVLGLVAEGLQNKNIASTLSLSEHTIKLHIHNILKKLGMTNRTSAAAWYTSFKQGKPGGRTSRSVSRC
ncbi:helix-turn-helix transcriptional regulator [Roseobacter sinensis]|uniref:Response regulator transcription factor n=1 Tax=Roseobacter sinensis TaxID=2931391 RepID=A0ABT3BJ40_9RHOB|nr:response regulator transcription factor [Roseobacter sp. WL0113]MCV3273589.1 response regulator transcription factor [Roseobacter sp. WL0113]